MQTALGLRRSERIEANGGIAEAMRLFGLWENGEREEDDSMEDENYIQEDLQQAGARAGSSRRRPRATAPRMRMGVRELSYHTYRDHWNVMHARLVSRGRLLRAWGEDGSDVKLEDLPAATQGDGDLLWW